MFRNFKDIENYLVENHIVKKIALANAHDRDALTSIVNARRTGVIKATLIGNTEKICRLLEEMGEDPADYELISCDNDSESSHIAVKMTHDGKADIAMKGLLHTATFMKAVLSKIDGLALEDTVLCQTTLFEDKDKDKLGLISDCALCITPTLRQKIQIIKNNIRLAHQLEIKKPNVCILSAVEVVRDNIPSTVDAQVLSMMQWGEAVVDGPFALDNAVSEEAARHKGITSPIAGKADILLVPDLCTGNIFIKSLIFFAHLPTAGILCGTSQPVVITSRTDTPENKYNSILCAVLQSVKADCE